MVFDTHSELIAAIGDLPAVQQRLKAGQLVIGENRQVQEADSTGLTKNKTGLRGGLIMKILQFSAALMAYATTAKNVELKTKANYTASELKTVPDSVLFDIGVLLMGLSIPIKADLTKYFVGEAEFKEIERLLADFKLAIPKRRVATSVSKASTGNIGEVFKAQDKLLKDEIDALMLPFRFTQPDFFNSYKNARIIVDYSGRGKPATAPAAV